MNYATIEEACEFVTDGAHFSPPDQGEGFPFLTVKDVSDEGLDFSNCSRISASEFARAKKASSVPVRGDVLFSKDGTVGKVHVVETDQEFAVLSSLAILKPNPSVLDSKFLGHVLKSPEVVRDAIGRKTGSAIRRIVLVDLKRVKIPLPPLNEQLRIAAILDKADEVRAKRKAALETLETLSQAIFIEMFGDPVTNPIGWEKHSLGDLCDDSVIKLGRGNVISKIDIRNNPGPYPIYSSAR